MNNENEPLKQVKAKRTNQAGFEIFTIDCPSCGFRFGVHAGAAQKVPVKCRCGQRMDVSEDKP